MRARARLFAVAALALLPCCFHPEQPACAFSCLDISRSCPPGFTCEADGVCHDRNSQGTCSIPPLVDAGAESSD